MQCPICWSKTKVKRTIAKGLVARERLCSHCQLKFRTVESVDLSGSLRVVKAGGRDVEAYDWLKIAKTLEWLSRVTPLPSSMREEILNEVHLCLTGLINQEVVSTGHLAELLYRSLKRRNGDAARRFGSRYVDEKGELTFNRDLTTFRWAVGSSSDKSQLDLFEE